MAYLSLQGVDKITPGTSTVAEFMTIIAVNLRDSSSSRTERQVNAFIMSCLVTHPSPCRGACAPLKARRELRHGMLAYLQNGL